MAQPLDKILVEQAKALFLQGLTPVQIGQRLDMKPDTVTKRAIRDDWLTQRAAVAANVDQIVSKAIIQRGASIRGKLASELDKQADALAREPVVSYGELANTKDRQGRASVVKTIAEAASKVYGWDNDANASLGFDLRILDVVDIEEVKSIEAPKTE